MLKNVIEIHIENKNRSIRLLRAIVSAQPIYYNNFVIVMHLSYYSKINYKIVMNIIWI